MPLVKNTRPAPSRNRAGPGSKPRLQAEAVGFRRLLDFLKKRRCGLAAPDDMDTALRSSAARRPLDRNLRRTPDRPAKQGRGETKFGEWAKGFHGGGSGWGSDREDWADGLEQLRPGGHPGACRDRHRDADHRTQRWLMTDCQSASTAWSARSFFSPASRIWRTRSLETPTWSAISSSVASSR